MIYVKRNESNQIIDICFDEKENYEKSSIFNEEIKTFIQNSNNQNQVKEIMTNLDLDMVRITEDVIEILIKKEILLFTDFPEAVQSKLLFKRFLRQALSKNGVNLTEDGESIQFN
ncbi:hypothetical protein [Hydrogenovibrio kuenenii]|uniref:hypothetical protein n=1 Tax=Hydrogenovibrio kuenenii TaxID=63658 RepID=UPI000463278A|nr:hypothetical protein [Hydrogenovibrio kuenenii]